MNTRDTLSWRVRTLYPDTAIEALVVFAAGYTVKRGAALGHECYTVIHGALIENTSRLRNQTPPLSLYFSMGNIGGVVTGICFRNAHAFVIYG